MLIGETLKHLVDLRRQRNLVRCCVDSPQRRQVLARLGHHIAACEREILRADMASAGLRQRRLVTS